MRELVNWKDHVVQYPGRFEEQDWAEGLCNIHRLREK